MPQPEPTAWVAKHGELGAVGAVTARVIAPVAKHSPPSLAAAISVTDDRPRRGSHADAACFQPVLVVDVLRPREGPSCPQELVEGANPLDDTAANREVGAVPAPSGRRLSLGRDRIVHGLARYPLRAHGRPASSRRGQDRPADKAG